MSRAELTFPFEAARAAVADFFDQFLGAMRERVLTIERDGWRRDDCRVDAGRLAAEQIERENLGRNLLVVTRMAVIASAARRSRGRRLGLWIAALRSR